MNNKTLGTLVAVVGVVLALVGVYFGAATKYGFGSKHALVALIPGVVLAVVGLAMFAMAGGSKANA